MELKKYIKHQIYDITNTHIPDNFSRLRILNPEYSTYESEVKLYPMQSSEHLFALLWDTHDTHTLSATILPSKEAFLYERDFESGSRTQLHSHEYLELFYVVDGVYRHRILGNEFTFHKGELCLIDKNCLHQEILDGSSATVIFLGISNAMFDNIMDEVNRISKKATSSERITAFLNTALLEQKSLQQYLYFHPRTDAVPVIENTLLRLIDELKYHDEASSLICSGLLLRILGILCTKYDFSLSKKLRQKMNWILFKEISEYMKENLKNISLSDLSNEFHFQEDYFNRLLKMQSGMTYTEYLQSIRLEQAESLLIHTDWTIDRIACEVGYHNKGYFYKIFTERHRLTPAQFRRRMYE